MNGLFLTSAEFTEDFLLLSCVLRASPVSLRLLENLRQAVRTFSHRSTKFAEKKSPYSLRPPASCGYSLSPLNPLSYPTLEEQRYNEKRQ